LINIRDFLKKNFPDFYILLKNFEYFFKDLKDNAFLLKSKIFFLLRIKIKGYNYFDELFLEFNRLIKITLSNKNLIRLGGQADGGYLVPDQIKKTHFLFSIGCDDKINFEIDYLKNNYFYNSKVFIIDPKKCRIKLPKNIFFINSFACSYNFNLKKNNNRSSYVSVNDFIKKNYKNFKYVLQIDCEGYEFEIIKSLENKILSRAEVIVIECHFNALLKISEGLIIINSFLRKILISHQIIHIHPNNALDNLIINGISVPRYCEITFVKKYKYKKKDSKIMIPHPLDIPNHKKREIKIPSIWY
jgi:hypothetical protein